MKKTFLLIALVISLYAKSQSKYGNQDSITLPTTSYKIDSVKALGHIPADYLTVQHPLILNFEGNGDAAEVNNANYYLYQLFGKNEIATRIKQGTWDCKAVNSVDGLSYEFIVITPLITHTGNTAIADWLNKTQFKSILNYVITKYNVDVSRIYAMGLSAGAFTVLDGILKDTSIANRIAAASFASAEGDGTFPPLLCNIATANIPSWWIYERSEQFNLIDSQYYFTINNCPPAKTAIRTLLPGSGHDGWYYADDPAFTDIASNNLSTFQWLLTNKRGNAIRPVNSITLNTPAVTTYCVSNSQTANITITGTSTGPFSGNAYKLYISSPSGSFASPVLIGQTTTNNTNTFTITGVIPAGYSTSNAYQIEVQSVNPAVTSNTKTITINLAANTVAPTTTQTIATNSPGTPLNVTNTSIADSVRWFVGTSAINLATALSYTPQFTSPGNYSLVAKSYFKCATITSNPVTINVVNNTTGHTYYATKNAGNAISLPAGSYSCGDSIHFKDLGYVDYLFCGLSGCGFGAGKQITLISEGNTVIDHVEFVGAHYIDFTLGKINSSKQGKVGLTIHYKSSKFYIHDGSIDSVYSWFFIKDNPDCDTSIDNYITDSITLQRLHCTNSTFDGAYLGNTSPCGAFASPCNVTMATPQLRDISVLNCYFNGSFRQGLQLSEASNPVGHKNVIAYDTILNSGLARETTLAQGVGLYIGGRTTKTYIHDCIIKSSFLENVVLSGSDSVFFYNNTLDSGGFVMGQRNTLGTYPNLTIKNQDCPGTPPKTFFVTNNQMGYHTFPTDVSINNLVSPNPAFTANNVFCYSGTITNQGVTVNTNCNIDTTICDTIHILPHDTCCQVVSKLVDTTIIRYRDSVRYKISYFKNAKWIPDTTIVIPHVPYTKDTIMWVTDSSAHFLTEPRDSIPCKSGPPSITFFDDFENATIDKSSWLTQSFNPSAISTSADVARRNIQSAKFSFNFIDWSDTATEDKRTELQGRQTQPIGRFGLDTDYWIGFSNYFPSTWSTDPTASIIWQFHGVNNGPGSNSPVLNGVINANKDSINVYCRNNSIIDTGGLVLLGKYPVIKGQWNDWVIHLKFSYTSGFDTVWVTTNNVTTRVGAYAGSNMYHVTGQLNDTGPFFKIGLYKPSWGDAGITGQASNLTIYDDCVIVGNNYADYNLINSLF